MCSAPDHPDTPCILFHFILYTFTLIEIVIMSWTAIAIHIIATSSSFTVAAAVFMVNMLAVLIENIILPVEGTSFGKSTITLTVIGTVLLYWVSMLENYRTMLEVQVCSCNSK